MSNIDNVNFIQNIYIQNFRIHQELQINIDNNNLIFLIGANKIGKTSVLEAISLIQSGQNGILDSENSKMINIHNNIYYYISPFINSTSTYLNTSIVNLSVNI